MQDFNNADFNMADFENMFDMDTIYDELNKVTEDLDNFDSTDFNNQPEFDEDMEHYYDEELCKCRETQMDAMLMK